MQQVSPEIAWSKETMPKGKVDCSCFATVSGEPNGWIAPTLWPSPRS